MLRAQALGHRAIAITDRNTLAGVVRAHSAAQELDLPLVGRLSARSSTTRRACSAFRPTAPPMAGSARLLTLGKRRAEKGECRLAYADVVEHGEGQICCVALPPDGSRRLRRAFSRSSRDDFAGRVYLAAQHALSRRRCASASIAWPRSRSARDVPLVATNDVLYHAAGAAAAAGRRHLHPRGLHHRRRGLPPRSQCRAPSEAAAEMARLFRDRPDAVARTLEIAERCRFSLDELRYEYPDETGA